MKYKSYGQLNIFSDSYLRQAMSQAYNDVINCPVWKTHLPKKVHSGKKNSSRKSDTEYDYIVYKFRGYPSPQQASVMKQNIGSCRWMWNRMVADRMNVINSTGRDTFRPTPARYKTNEQPWLSACDSYALCNVQLNVESTFSNWHSGKCGKPNFKKKHVCRDSYTTNRDKRSDNISLVKGQLTLPKVPGGIRVTCHKKIRQGGILKSVTVSHEPDGKWMFSIKYAYPKKQSFLPGWLETGDLSSIRHIGLDMSLPELYIDSNGNMPSYELCGHIIVFDKQYKKLEKKIAHEQRALSRMVRGSHNYEKQLIRIARLYAKAKHIRHDFLRQMAARLARNYDVISIEDLDMRALKQSLHFGKSVSDNAWGTFLIYLEEACHKTGSFVIRVDKWFPSSKTCSHCGYIKKDLKLNERTYICPQCGHVMNRDHQAAVNIDREGLNIIRSWFEKPVHMKPHTAA